MHKSQLPFHYCVMPMITWYDLSTFFARVTRRVSLVGQDLLNLRSTWDHPRFFSRNHVAQSINLSFSFKLWICQFVIDLRVWMPLWYLFQNLFCIVYTVVYDLIVLYFFCHDVIVFVFDWWVWMYLYYLN